jgi:hypothetical protein
MRMLERDFTSLDVERVLKGGKICEPPEHDLRHGNWKYKIRAPIEGCCLEIVVVIDDQEDYDLCPLILPVTGYWTGRGARDGKRIEPETASANRKAAKKDRKK